jgi:hypothetical protein
MLTDETTDRVQRIARLFAAYAMRTTTEFRIVVARYPDGRMRAAIQVRRDVSAPKDRDYLEGAASLTVYPHTEAPTAASAWTSTMPTPEHSRPRDEGEALAMLEGDLRDAAKRQAAHFRDIAAQRTREAEAMERSLRSEETNR